jgi:thiamine transport system ATP-binding protein
VLRVEGAVVQFEGRRVVDAVDLVVVPGETVALLGPSGSGKTTLLRAIAGLQSLQAGRITWDGNDLTAVPPNERHFGMVFQEYALFPHRDVAGNVEFGLRMAGASASERERRTGEVLDLVGLRDLGGRRIATLSGGEQQRVALARALAVSPRLLMLDEPLGALDRVWRTRLLDEIRAILERTALPALYVTHDHHEAFAIASTVCVMRDGRIVQQGAPREVWARPVDAWTAAFFGFGPAVTATVRGGELETPWAVLRAPAQLGEAGDIDLVVRPDAVRIDPKGGVSGIVQRVTFAGDIVTAEIALERGPSLQVTVPAASLVAPGEEVRVAIDPELLLVYPRPAD